MAITDTFVLAPDVQLVQVSDLADEIRSRIEAADNAYAIARPGSRVAAKLLDVRAAALVRRFVEPITIVQAVVQTSRAAGEDEAAYLSDAYPLLRSLIRSGLLVPAAQADASRIVAAHKPGDHVCRCTVQSCLRVLSDTEIYLVQPASGGSAILKLARAGAGETLGDFETERRVLARTGGTIAPRLFDSGIDADRAFLVMEFCRGIDAGRAAADIREVHAATSRERLGTLACSIVEAYAALHSAGVVHGDVHNANLLVSLEGRITLLDFGLSRLLEDVRLPAHRGGAGHYFEPEYAAAHLAGTPRPPATPQGEQYLVAAMIYEILADAAYAEFALDEPRAFRQIAEDPPLSFATRGAVPWPAVEAVLGRALAKQPGDRFASMQEFASALRAAVADVPQREQRSRDGTRRATRAHRSIRQQLMRSIGRAGPLLRRGLPAPPTASVSFGAAGVAFACYRLSMLADDPELLALADTWSMRAWQLNRRRDAFVDDLMLTEGAVDRFALHHGVTGINVTRALVAHAQGDFAGMGESVHRLGRLPGKSTDLLDLSTGVVGMLLGLALVRECSPDVPAIDLTPLDRAGRRCRETIVRALAARPPIANDTKYVNLGIAHGWAGALYALLRWSEATSEPLPDSLQRRLDELAALAQPFERGVRWPWRGVSEDGTIGSSYMPGWCNGSAGFVHLWLAAHAATLEERYLELAQGAALDACDNSGSGAFDLCCGAAGAAYAALAIHRAVEDTVWLRRAEALVDSAMDDVTELDDLRPALLKGPLGVLLVHAEMEVPHLARMPMFESEGWPKCHPAIARGPQ